MSAERIAFHIAIVPASMQGHTRSGLSADGRPMRYKDATALAYEMEVMLGARPFAPPEPIGHPVHLALTFYRPRPKRNPGWVAPELWKSGRRVPYRVASAHDIDNLSKPVIDAIKGDFFVDDGVVTSLYARRFYAARRGAPGIVVVIENHEDEA